MAKNKPAWLEVEKVIQKEITWIRSVILPYQPNKNLLNYADDIFYNDLRLVYFKSLCDKLPDIQKINEYKSVGKIELDDINKII